MRTYKEHYFGQPEEQKGVECPLKITLFWKRDMPNSNSKNALKNRLKLLALEALEQVCAQSKNGPVPKTRSLAFTLAYLWSHGGGERWRYDGFWKSATGEKQSYANWSRYGEITSFLSGIYHAHGLTRTSETLIRFDQKYGRPCDIKSIDIEETH